MNRRRPKLQRAVDDPACFVIFAARSETAAKRESEGLDKANAGSIIPIRGEIGLKQCAQSFKSQIFVVAHCGGRHVKNGIPIIGAERRAQGKAEAYNLSATKWSLFHPRKPALRRFVGFQPQRALEATQQVALSQHRKPCQFVDEFRQVILSLADQPMAVLIGTSFNADQHEGVDPDLADFRDRVIV